MTHIVWLILYYPYCMTHGTSKNGWNRPWHSSSSWVVGSCPSAFLVQLAFPSSFEWIFLWKISTKSFSLKKSFFLFLFFQNWINLISRVDYILTRIPPSRDEPDWGANALIRTRWFWNMEKSIEKCPNWTPNCHTWRIWKWGVTKNGRAEPFLNHPWRH